MTAQLIRDYRNLPGEHCGSTAMRNLVFHYCGLDLAEEEIFGLGSGVDCVVIQSEAFAPGVLLFGRGSTMEVDAAEALGIDYREQIEADDDEAWRLVREEVVAGRPTMLSGDAFYLDYRDFRVHFPSHRFVLVGFDDARRIAYVADRLDPAAQECSYDALAKSRNPKDFLSTFNLWGRFADTAAQRALPGAYERAIARAARRMTGAQRRGASSFENLTAGEGIEAATGLAALVKLGDVIAHLPAHPRAKEIARYASACIEAFGTGGGNFRTMYAGFLTRARRLVPHVVGADAPELAAASSKLWTALSEQLGALAKGEADASAADLRDAVATVAKIGEAETRLFESLASASAATHA